MGMRSAPPPVTAHILSGPDQVPSRPRVRTRDRYRHDLAQVEQPGQVPGIPGIGLDPVPTGPLNRRGRRDQALDPATAKNLASPYPVGPAS